MWRLAGAAAAKWHSLRIGSAVQADSPYCPSTCFYIGFPIHDRGFPWTIHPIRCDASSGKAHGLAGRAMQLQAEPEDRASDEKDGSLPQRPGVAVPPIARMPKSVKDR